MKRTIKWMSALGAAATLAWTLGCGGGGGGGGGSGSQITGSLSRSGSVATACLRSSSTPTWLARAAAWLGARTAIADGTTDCGNPTVPADGVTVTLLLNGAVVQTTVTNADGEFSFTNLAPGDYVVQVTLPSGTISTPAIVQPGQQTTLVGELDLDCNDVDSDGNNSEVALHVEQTTDDGSELDADETEDGGQISEDDGQDSEDQGDSSSSGGSSGSSSGSGGGSSEDGGSSSEDGGSDR